MKSETLFRGGTVSADDMFGDRETKTPGAMRCKSCGGFYDPEQSITGGCYACDLRSATPKQTDAISVLCERTKSEVLLMELEQKLSDFGVYARQSQVIERMADYYMNEQFVRSRLAEWEGHAWIRRQKVFDAKLGTETRIFRGKRWKFRSTLEGIQESVAS